MMGDSIKYKMIKWNIVIISQDTSGLEQLCETSW